MNMSLAFPIKYLLHLLMALLVYPVQFLMVDLPVLRHHTLLARPAHEELLHLSRQDLQLVLQLLVLLLKLGHRPAQRRAQLGRLLQTSLHPHLESADVDVDFPDGVPERVLVAGQGGAHGFPLRRAGPGVAVVAHFQQGLHHRRQRYFGEGGGGQIGT